MGIHFKRKAKAAALEAASMSVPGGGFFARSLMGRMRIDFDPPTGQVEYPDGAPSAACISIDFDANTPSRKKDNHEGTEALVDLSEKYSIPLTWAICGKDAVADPEAYRRLKESTVTPEIGVHTYSHIDVSKSTAQELEGEISRCVAVLGLDRPPRTFVFPWNREGHFDVLRKMGFVVYRSKRRAISAPFEHEGLWNIPPVYYVDHLSLGAGALVKRYLDLCVRYRSVFHLWLHPWSIVERGDTAAMVRTTLDPVFSYMKEKRDASLLSTTTMEKLADCASAKRLAAAVS